MTEPAPVFNLEQTARAEAVKIAAQLLKIGGTGPLTTVTSQPAAVADIIDLAAYIVEGLDDDDKEEDEELLTPQQRDLLGGIPAVMRSGRGA